MKALPEIHKTAFKYKNFDKLQHDGGRAWIKNPQTGETIKGTNKHMVITVKEDK